MKVSPSDLASTWVVEQEHAGVPGLLGVEIRIEVQQVNPFVRRTQISPLKQSAGDAKFAKIFEKVKPAVVSIQGDLLLCSMGIIARRKL